MAALQPITAVSLILFLCIKSTQILNLVLKKKKKHYHGTAFWPTIIHGLTSDRIFLIALGAPYPTNLKQMFWC